MSVGVDLGSLVLYVVQQIGVLVTVGAQTTLLVAYLLSIRDKTLSAGETKFGRIATKILRAGLVLVVFSGAGAIVFHLLLGQGAIIEAPAFLFKWGLIVLVLCLTIAQGRMPYTNYLLEGFAGANWYALLVVHVVAPVIAWTTLIIFYVVGVGAFMTVWGLLVYMFDGKSIHEQPVVKAAPKVTPPAPMPPKAVAPPPQPRQIPHIVVPAPEPVRQPIVIKKVETSPPPPPPPKKIAVAPVVVKQVPHINLSARVPQKPHQLPEVLSSHTVFAAPHKPAPVAMSVPHKPVAPPVPVPQKPPVAALVPQKPPATPVIKEDVHDPDEAPELPAIWVMPRTPEEVQFKNRPSAVQFTQE